MAWHSCANIAPMKPYSLAFYLSLVAQMSGAVIATETPKPMTAQEVTDAAADTQMRIDDAIPIVGKLKEDPKANDLLGKAKGIVIVPNYMQAALVFGARGGSGLLLVRRGLKWSDPVFYRISGGTFGAQIGGTKGALAFFLMSDRAIEAFQNKPSTWSMDAGAGLSAISFSKQTPDTATLTDVVVWSETRGLFGGAAVGATKISRDMQANQMYYRNNDITAQQILSGEMTSPQSKLLLDALPPPAPAQLATPGPSPQQQTQQARH
jgi:SH3 domain-containing YSC84-like protein 1